MDKKTNYTYHSPRVPIKCDCPKINFYNNTKRNCYKLANKIDSLCKKNSKNTKSKCENISKLYHQSCKNKH